MLPRGPVPGPDELLRGYYVFLAMKLKLTPVLLNSERQNKKCSRWEQLRIEVLRCLNVCLLLSLKANKPNVTY